MEFQVFAGIPQFCALKSQLYRHGQRFRTPVLHRLTSFLKESKNKLVPRGYGCAVGAA
jgi:hypothetical protein